ncbi:sigma-70 family RNA polymerase sigma factor [Persicobacter sp. CCB-QB2]|nr:sigma-70 family RNA polymerase sigma factor [Persicobacter sp. CCB-QB2]
MELTQSIITYRPLLFKVAMEILDDLKDAEDVVQETLIKWTNMDRSKVANPKAYLVRAVTNACLNFKKQWRHKMEMPWSVNMSEFLPSTKEMEDFKADIDHQLHSAYQTMVKKLSPLERGPYMLREFFDLEYPEISEIFEKKMDHCRQLVSRAKQRLEDQKERFQIEAQQAKKGYEHFLKASREGNLEDFINFLKEDTQKEK